jgi:hypothetical protein
MHRLIFYCLIFHAGISLGQNVKLEIADYSRKIDGKEYATFQFVRASYSFSRATLVFITSRPLFLELTQQVPQLFNIKQEYTDVWILGITDFDPKSVTSIDDKIISNFLQKIIKYRNDNDLPPYSLQQLEDNKIFISNKEDICKSISCRKIPWQ